MYLFDLPTLIVAACVGACSGRIIGWMGARLPAWLFNAWHREALAQLAVAPDAVSPMRFDKGIDRWRWTTPITALVTVAIAASYGGTYLAAGFIGLAWALMLVSLIDAEHQVLPDVIVIPLLWVGMLVSLLGVGISLHDAVLGAISGYSALWLTYWGFRLITGREGLGHGDMKLMAVIGAWGGWQILWITVLLACVAAVLIAGFRQWRSGSPGGTSEPFPFGPYLALAGLLGVCWGDTIVGWYLEFLVGITT